MQNLIEKHSSLKKDGYRKRRRVWDGYRMGRADLDSLRGKLTFYTSTISVFMDRLEITAISRIELTLDKIYARLMYQGEEDARQSQISLISLSTIVSQIEEKEDDAWDIIQRELTNDGIPPTEVAVYKQEIMDYVKASVDAEGAKVDARLKERGAGAEQLQISFKSREEGGLNALRAFRDGNMAPHISHGSLPGSPTENAQRWRHHTQDKAHIETVTRLQLLEQGRSGFQAGDGDGMGLKGSPSCQLAISLAARCLGPSSPGPGRYHICVHLRVDESLGMIVGFDSLGVKEWDTSTTEGLGHFDN